MMKKTLSLIAAAVLAVCGLSAHATTVTVSPVGDKYTISVDGITIDNVKAVQQNGVNVLAVNRDGVALVVRFTDVNTLVASGTVNGIEINYASEAAAMFAAKFQLPNGNFEDWHASSGEPDHWHGFKSAKGTFASLATSTLGSSTDVRTGATGKSAVVKANSVWGVVANGTITNGQLNAGNMSASSPDNHSEMDVNSTATDKNDDPFYTALYASPDALKSWMKLSVGNTSHKATINAIVFDGTYYQDPENTTYTNVAAKAGTKNIENGGWREVVLNFDYDSYSSNNAASNAILITASTNAKAGTGTSGDQLWLDDMELVYNSGITGITINGLDGFTFDAAQHEYTFVGNYGTITADNISVTTNGHSAIVAKNVEDLGCGNYRIAIAAVSADMVGASLYTITITRPVWIMGEVNGNGWAPNVGALMNYNEQDQTYTLDITTSSEYANSYFSFTGKLAESGDDSQWNEIAPYRFGAVTESEETNFVMRKMYLGQELALSADGRCPAFQFPSGENFTLTIKDIDGDRKLIVTGDSWPEAKVYVQGSFNGWSDLEGLLEMTLTEGVYTADYESVDNGDGFSYFKLLKKEYGEQDQVIGAVSEGDFWVSNETLNTPLSITADGGQAFRIPAGQFTLAANLEAMELTIGGSLGILGDLNADGNVDVTDVSLLIDVVLGKTPVLAPGVQTDLNDDGNVDVSDVSILIDIVLGKY